MVTPSAAPAAADAEAPNRRTTTNVASGTNEAVTMGQLLAKDEVTVRVFGRWPAWVCSASNEAYCSASQYTTRVTNTVTSNAAVLNVLPLAAMTAAVMIVP
jgi:hypothetical protein